MAFIYDYTFGINANSDDVVIGSGHVASCDREHVRWKGTESSCASQQRSKRLITRQLIAPASKGPRFYELEATTAFDRWLKSKGHATEALTVLTKIYSWFTEGFDAAALRDAKTLLDEMSARPKKRAPRPA